MIALLCGGQGEEVGPGHLAVARQTALGRDLLGLANTLTGRDLSRDIERQSPALAQTDVCQPLIAALSLGAYAALGSPPGMVVGHSLGDLIAASMAGYLAPDDAVRLARLRGELMAEVARQHPGGLVATHEDPAGSGLALAAHNAADEWVVAYLEPERERALALPGARRLAVAGPWHHPVFAPLAAPFAAAVARVERSGGSLDWASFTGGDKDVATLLATQLARPVRFRAVLQGMVLRGARAFVTLGPARAVRGFARKASALPVFETSTLSALLEASAGLLENRPRE